jgi:hypothetical protein
MDNELPGIELLHQNDKYESIIENNKINFHNPAIKPEIIMRIWNGYDYQRLFTLSNFSAITGKSKAKKTYLISLFTAAAVGNCDIQNYIMATLPEGKDLILHFDTEQGDYDCYESGNRVNRLLGKIYDNYYIICLREFTPKERCEIIDYIITKFKDKISYVVIDGITDLVNAINDEIEATRVTSLLMKWTKIFNIHICVAIHENWGNDKATGHIGSFILKKAECIISVKKNKEQRHKSTVENTYMRGVRDFEDFEIIIENDGLPYINNAEHIRYIDEQNISKIQPNKLNPEPEETNNEPF